MALEKIAQVSGQGVFIPGSDIDTDRIIPARFMKCVTFDGLGQYLFYDARHDSEDAKTDHPLNDERFSGASVMVSGINFGCGSSREHAPQAIYRAGFRAVIAQSFADIFFGNCTTLGIPCAAVLPEDIEKIAAMVDADPATEITVDVAKSKILYGDQECPASFPDAAKEALLSGKWDPIGELLEGADQIEDTASRLPYFVA